MTQQTEIKGVQYVPLAQKVLAVAVCDPRNNSFRVYIDAVLGKDHPTETQTVVEHGKHAFEPIARAIFPWLFDLEYQ